MDDGSPVFSVGLASPKYLAGCWMGSDYLSRALSGIDPTLYEAAMMDGANRWRQVWHITLPGLQSVIVIMFILRFGHMLDLGFEHIFRRIR